MNEYDFQQEIDRLNTSCLKWDTTEEGVVPMWIADMDFPVAPEIQDAMQKRLNHPVFGYTYESPELLQAITDWNKKRHNWHIQEEWICLGPGVVPILTLSILANTQPGDDILIMTPVYRPFYHIIRSSGRNAIHYSLERNEENYYSIDFNKLEESITDRTRMLILCSPHNPVGRVWKKSELERISEICHKHNLIVVSDEIHADFVFPDHKHIPYASISEYAAEHSITALAPSKTFNIAGLCQAYAVIQNPQLRSKFMSIYNTIDLGNNIFGMCALTAAYTEGEPWLNELLITLKSNLDFAVAYIRENIPAIKVCQPEATFLLWLDCSKLGLRGPDLEQHFTEVGKVRMNPGYRFGEEADTFMRLNIGCPRTQLTLALERIKHAVESLEV